jgi:hypothetical protein
MVLDEECLNTVGDGIGRRAREVDVLEVHYARREVTRSGLV